MTLALDLEGTLISNAVSQIPRPGLGAFLAACARMFERIVIYTSVPETRFRSIAAELVARREAPAWFARIDYVRWEGPYKRPGFVQGGRPGEVVLLDDQEAYVHPDDRGFWVRIAPFEYPYSPDDRGLEEALAALASYCPS